MTLIEILTGTLSYDRQWQIWAQRIDGEFKPESAARFGQAQFEHGGLRDDFMFFANNQYATDHMANYIEGVPDAYQDEFAEEAALNLIMETNEMRALEEVE